MNQTVESAHVASDKCEHGRSPARACKRCYPPVIHAAPVSETPRAAQVADIKLTHEPDGSVSQRMVTDVSDGQTVPPPPGTRHTGGGHEAGPPETHPSFITRDQAAQVLRNAVEFSEFAGSHNAQVLLHAACLMDGSPIPAAAPIEVPPDIEPTGWVRMSLKEFRDRYPPSEQVRMAAAKHTRPTGESGSIDVTTSPAKWGRELPPTFRNSSNYRLSVWRDSEGHYHLTELVREDGRWRERDLYEPDYWETIDGALGSEIVELMTP